MRTTLLFVLAMVLMGGWCWSDSTTEPTTTSGPGGLDTAPRSEIGGTWPEGVSVGDISWRRVDLMGVFGAVRVSYKMTFTNNDPSRAVRVNYYLYFLDSNGFELAYSIGHNVTISAASSREVGGTVSLASVTTVYLANQITEMSPRASFTF